MEEYNFTRGELIVPNDDLQSAFKYDPENTVLYEGATYRVATSAEFIWFSKYSKLTPMNKGIEEYKKSQGDKVGKIYEHIEKQNENAKKQGLS